MGRKPRIISTAVIRKVQKERARVCKTSPYIDWPKGENPNILRTSIDRLYDKIDRQSVKMYRFTDNEYGIPWISKGDIESRGDGIYVIRFRCPPEKLAQIYFWSMAADVCREIGCEINFFHEIKEERNIPYAECVWVINEPEEEEEETDDFYTLEEFPDDYRDESTAEEIEDRLVEVEEKFL